MTRLFQRHRTRSVVSLDGLWDFCFIERSGANALDVSALMYDERAAVPGCFDANPPPLGRRGTCAYRRAITLGKHPHHRLNFGAVNHTARVFLDGRLLGEHVGGHSPFSVEITGFNPGGHELVVLADNRFDYESNPLHHEHFDWYQFGGIPGSVTLEALADVWIEHLAVRTLDWRSGRAGVRLTLGALDHATGVQAVVDCGGLAEANFTLDLEPGMTVAETEVQLEDARPWTPAEPNLYEFRASVAGDDLIERVGLREIRVEGKQILLNDEPIRLVGFNRHHIHPGFGFAMPSQLIRRDVEIIREIGANFVRGSHYPQDPLFLDLCDEAGLMVWSETMGWNLEEKVLADERYIGCVMKQVDEMVLSSMNHPSVIMWGVLNECASDAPGSRSAYEKQFTRMKELDPTRPVTYASSRYKRDLFFDLADIVSVNVYPGWYNDLPHPGETGACLEWLREFLAAGDQGGKPVIVSEIGAGAIYGCLDPIAGHWTEQYQAWLLGEAVDAFLASDLAGLAIWQFSDTRTTTLTRSVLFRPRGFNNKGVVDEYRRPKQAFDVVRKKFTRWRDKR